MNDIKFDPKKLAKLNDPGRYESMPPDRIWEELDLKTPKVLVDIGAGTGFFSVPFQKKTASGKVYACDISEIMLDWMRENLGAETLRSVIPTKMRESSVPLDSLIADLVFMINLHHELKDPEKILAESFRLLVPGGKLLIIDWKPVETEKGPPLKIRVKPEKVLEQLKGGGFTRLTEHTGFRDHFMISASKAN
ncbi:MAG: class I SAM-dependent methyltransferase [Deltaproteobacteria bacterium]|nr:class I SAM-dependent methyltransferase [Deltaproteobacteria bacterium]